MAEAAAALGSGAPGATDLAAEVLHAIQDHGRHEDEFIHPLLRRHLPAIATDLDHQHEALDDLIVATMAALTAPDPYRPFQRFIAENLRHLDHEETVVLPLLWRAVPDHELAEIRTAFMTAHPEANDLYRRWPAHLTPAERGAVSPT
jgi:hypothetical protein